jgi:hypothetical protein
MVNLFKYILCWIFFFFGISYVIKIYTEYLSVITVSTLPVGVCEPCLWSPKNTLGNSNCNISQNNFCFIWFKLLKNRKNTKKKTLLAISLKWLLISQGMVTMRWWNLKKVLILNILFYYVWNICLFVHHVKPSLLTFSLI